jgi:hypothetical protein
MGKRNIFAILAILSFVLAIILSFDLAINSLWLALTSGPSNSDNISSEGLKFYLFLIVFSSGLGALTVLLTWIYSKSKEVSYKMD